MHRKNSHCTRIILYTGQGSNTLIRFIKVIMSLARQYVNSTSYGIATLDIDEAMTVKKDATVRCFATVPLPLVLLAE